MNYHFWVGCFCVILISFEIHLPEALQIDDDQGTNSKSEECASVIAATGKYEKIHPSSKYLSFRSAIENDKTFTCEDAVRICDRPEFNLEIAEVNNVEDIISLQKHIYANMWIGLNHVDHTGIFKQANGRNVDFQSFVGWEPNNSGDSEKCVILKRTDDFLGMEDANCDESIAGALCQFKMNSHCYLQSAEETSVKAPDDIESLGTGGHFFIGLRQKTWIDARDFCSEKGKRLLVLDNPANQELSENIKKRLAEQSWNPWTQFWTAGLFSASYEYLYWQVDDGSSEFIAEPTLPFTWANASGGLKEPVDQSGSRKENCLDISFENIDLASAGNYAPMWRASNCLLPKYFICHSELAQLSGLKEPDEGDEETSSEAGEPMACNVTKLDPVNFEIDLKKKVDEEDIVKLLIFNIENDVKSGLVMLQLKDTVKWKGDVVNLLIEIGKKSIDSDYVDHGLLNVVKIFVLMYLNAASNENDTVNENIWKTSFIPHLTECLDKTSKLDLSGSGLEVFYVKYGEDEESIFVPEEQADLLKNLDSAVEFLWFLFSFSLARCYAYPSNRITFASDFHVNFIADFLDPLREKWTVNEDSDPENSDPTGLDYKLALGDVDYFQSYRNLRFAVTAAYIANNISDIQLVRPIDFSFIEDDGPVLDNSRTGQVLFAESIGALRPEDDADDGDDY